MRIALSLQGVLGGFDGVMETMASMLKRSVSTDHYCYEVGSTHTGGQRGVDGQEVCFSRRSTHAMFLDELDGF